ncbi:collagen alpha-1(I) chain [Biomphalaria pfeifferi]|uniref:Collagen alpha-1(I) chain n=1 Tax=Biomphalaria pfeifferi TaxID=112525 RepID=A0AAD8BC60_BIOPF|nr:collagen alpha-1(I) chain [Biomphalaria pfeifferi]
MFDAPKPYKDEIKTNSDDTSIRGLYILFACLTLTFTLSFSVCYLEMTHLRTTVGKLQALKNTHAIDRNQMSTSKSGSRCEESNSEGENVLTQTKRWSIQDTEYCRKQDVCIRGPKGDRRYPGAKDHTVKIMRKQKNVLSTS